MIYSNSYFIEILTSEREDYIEDRIEYFRHLRQLSQEEGTPIFSFDKIRKILGRISLTLKSPRFSFR